jgi:hypothetical protein
MIRRKVVQGFSRKDEPDGNGTLEYAIGVESPSA